MDNARIARELLDMRARIDGLFHTQSAFAIALLSTHPDPPAVMRRFRRLVEGLQDPADSEVFAEFVLDFARRYALAFDQAVQLALPPTDPQHQPDPG